MADEDDKADEISLPLAQEEALRLKTLAEQNYSSNNLKSALIHAKRAHKLHPNVDGLPELLTAFKILRTAAAPIFPAAATPDYYKILDVERFSHINTIKKQYKKLALILHPDKSSGAASEEAFKLVGEAIRVLSDKIRRKEYDMRLRIAMQSELEVEPEAGAGAVEGGVVGVEWFWAACSSCRLLNQFERKYFGHNLMCPSCKKSFKAVEVEENCEIPGDVGGDEGEGVGLGQTRVSARIQERVAKGGKLGVLEKSGGKREISGLGDVLERTGVKIARNTDEDEDGVLLKDLRFKTVKSSGGRDNGGVKVYQSRRLQKAMNADSSEQPGSSNKNVVNELALRKVGGKDRNEVDEEKDMSGAVEIVENKRAKRAKAREEETMTLAQMQILAKKTKVDKGKLMVKEKEVNQNLTRKKKEDLKVKEKAKKKEKEKAKAKANKIEKEEDEERETEDVTDLESEGDLDLLLVEKEKEKEKKKDKNNGREKEKQKEKEKKSEKKNKEMDNEGKEKEIEKSALRGVSKDGNLEVENRTSDNHLNVDTDDDLEITPVEKEKEKKQDEKEKQNQRVNTRPKRERRRVSKYSDVQILNDRTSENHMDSEIEKLRSLKKGNLEIMSVEDSDFHDFDQDRRERSFKKGQVWAVYDEDDGMPRHYVLINNVVSVNPFEVRLSWLQFHNNGDEELISWEKMGFRVSCGRFKVSSEVSVKYLNLFSHIADCERVAREAYVAYPKKGSVWALYDNNILNAKGRNGRIKDKRCNIIVALSSYSDMYGLSVAYLEKVDGFRTVFKRNEIGAHAVISLGKDDMKLFSHQIPAKKLSGEEASGLPKNCWELDPGSLTPQLLVSL